MNQQDFFLLIGTLSILFVFWMRWGHKTSQGRPNRLFLRQNKTPEGLSSPTKASQVVVQESELIGGQEPTLGSRDLNVLFHWEGQVWDAYEVLELPSGSSMSDVKRSYAMLSQRDLTVKSKIEAAYSAILQKSKA